MPQETHDLCQKFFNGDFKGSLSLQRKLYPLTCALFNEVNPIPIKSALNELSFNQGKLREPLYEIEPQNLDILKTEMKKLNLL